MGGRGRGGDTSMLALCVGVWWWRLHAREHARALHRATVSNNLVDDVGEGVGGRVRCSH